MNKIAGNRKRSVVKIFTTATTCFLLVCGALPIRAFAAESTDSKLLERLFGGSGPDKCKEARQEFKDAQTKLSEACRKGGFGDDCNLKSLACAEESSEDSFDTIGAFGTVLGLPTAGLANISSKCPFMSGKDYFTEKERIQKEIKDMEKELAELNDAKAEVQESYQKKDQENQEALAKAQEDYKKKDADLDQEERERIADFNNNQNQAREGLRKKSDELLNLRGQVIQLNRDKARALNQMSESAGKRKCVADLAKMRKEYTDIYSNSTVSSGNHIATAKRKKQELIDFYNTCMSDFNQQRIALNETTRQRQESLDKQIRDTQSSLDEVQNSLNLASTQLEEMKAATKKQKNDALQSVIDLGTRLQQQLQSAYTKMQENLKTIAAKSASLQGALNRANQDILSLGGAPKRGSEITRDEVTSEIRAQTEILMGLKDDPSIASCGGLKETIEKSIKSKEGKGSGRTGSAK